MAEHMADGMKILVGFTMLERPDLSMVDAEFAVSEVIRERGWSGTQIEVDNVIEFLGALRERLRQ